MKEHTVQGLLELFLKTNDLKKLVDEASRVLKNPLLICDTSYHFLAHSVVKDVKDKSWLSGIKRGNWRYEWVEMMSHLDLDYSGRTHKTQILTNINHLTTSRRKIGTLCLEGSHFGYYLVLEENTPFDEISDETYRQVEKILAKCMCLERPYQMTSKGDSCESLILDLLQSDFDNERVFLERAAKSDLARKGDYRVFCIDVKEYTNNSGSARNVFNGRINDIRSAVGQCLPLSWQVYVQDYIIVLAEFSSRFYQSKETLESFGVFLDEKQLFAGQSDRFSNVYYLKRYYEQAKTALELGRSFQEQRRIIQYDDYKIYSLFQKVSDKNLFEQYSTEDIRRICKYDEENGTEYFETIYHYLGNHCSIRKTAQNLYVHRNTVAYRITRMEDLFGLTFDNDFRNYNNYTSCLLRRYTQNRTLEERE